jgi:Fur family transcriptional regulator, zinc uptake regulator
MTRKTISNVFPSPRHDHDACIDTALQQAEQLCIEKGLRLTPIRRRVFELVWQSHQPVSAYTLLEQLVREGHRAQAPTVYRSLEFLLQCGLIHRVESMNAYLGCNQPQHGHEVGMFICRACGDVAELSDDSISNGITDGAERIGFTVESRVVEVTGTCRACARAGKNA